MSSNSRLYTFFNDKVVSPVKLETELNNIVMFWNNHEQGLQQHTTLWTAQLWIAPTVVTSASPYNALVTDCVIISNKTVAGAGTINLSSTLQTGRVVIIKDGKGDANANNITVQGNGKNIDGAASKVINTAYGVLRVIYNGTEWSSI
jgi:hypothetical protein